MASPRLDGAWYQFFVLANSTSALWCGECGLVWFLSSEESI
jgi:hypothetical protein